MEDDEHATRRMQRIKLEDRPLNGASLEKDKKSSTPTADVKENGSQSPAMSLDAARSRSDGTDTPTSSKPARLSRKSSQKPIARDPVLFGHLPDATLDSAKTFQVIPDCLYGSKHLGSTDNDAFDCDCREEWRDGENVACGEDTDCINRATKMECSATSGNCSNGCQNQRFQRKQYAGVSVIKTEKKGFGLRSDSELQANDFIFEYIGEVINEPTFRRRMLQYDEEGVKHFYFMSLSKSEFVDATKKGNLGRFCNHSCNPNCYVDKWVIGDKLRMGIFALRNIQPGEELVFNYNVDRYGAEPQPCYCGEPNCVGFIGGKTQTERATKLPAATVEALGIDGADGWDTTVAKKPRRKRADEDDEEYVNSLQPRGLDEEDARKVMAALMQCKEKWIAVKLLERIQLCEEERVVQCVMRMHAYQILKTTLNTFIEDHNVILQVLAILDKFPRLTRNKIQDSNIETTIESLAESENEEVASKCKRFLDEWSKLEVAYRIRRRKLDPNAPTQHIFEDRRGQAREEEMAQSTPKPASPQTIDAPKGPRNSAPQRSAAFFPTGPRPRRPFNAPLPQGWFAAKDGAGNTYFYNKQGTTTWQRPTQPADSTPKAPSKAIQEQLLIQSIIDRVTKESTPKQSVLQPVQTINTSPRDSKRDKWRSLPVDKQMKIYENTINPPVKHVLDKFRNKLPKDELKRLGKDIAKKLVASDYKNGRVGDPAVALGEKQERKIKKYVKDFLDRAVAKYDAHQKRRPGEGPGPETGAPGGNVGSGQPTSARSPIESPSSKEQIVLGDIGETAAISDVDSPDSPGLKRKRETGDLPSTGGTPQDGPELKRLKEDSVSAAPSPPPPPPPPPELSQRDEMTDEQKALREQEEALMRENEEAQRLEDEANHTKEMEGVVDNVQKDISTAQKQEVLSH